MNRSESEQCLEGGLRVVAAIEPEHELVERYRLDLRAESLPSKGAVLEGLRFLWIRGLTGADHIQDTRLRLR